MVTAQQQRSLAFLRHPTIRLGDVYVYVVEPKRYESDDKGRLIESQAASQN